MPDPDRQLGKYGRRSPKISPALKLSSYLTGAIPDHPAFADYLARLNGWQMLGNGPDPANEAAGIPASGAGNCVAVTWSSTRRLVTSVLSTENYPALDQVIELHKTQNPGFPQQDEGMELQTCLEYLVHTGGPDGVKAIGFAKVDHTKPDEVKAAIAIFGSVWTGVNVQQAQEQQFDAGQPWDWVPGSPLSGGHSIITGGYGAPGAGVLGGDERFITWSQETSFTDSYWANGVEEAWVVVWPEHLGSKAFLDGVELAEFAIDYMAITGRVFPVPVPQPASVLLPPLVPLPDTDPADVALAHSVTAWAYGTHDEEDLAVAGALRAWLTAKGFPAG